ncbi:MAG: tRNA 4-thiouridine(8) synthase ThiI [Candidatus Bathyarchaeota archaeon]|nr:tRNA 4-thiouridine(8) synthase ThiI [Candidatus Bathyarchaeota archaeon]
METLLVAYGEIALKSRSVRGRLERLLARQIEYSLRRRGHPGARVLRRFGRLYVEGSTEKAAGIVADVFGVVSVMPALKTGSGLPEILELTVEVASERIGDGQTFAIRPKVVGQHPFSSRDLAVEAGSAVLEAASGRGVRVDLSQPDVTIFIEVRDRDAFVYTRVVDGVRGLPYGSQGRLVSLFSGGIDSPVATWLVMKRGAEVLPLFMDQRPHVGESYVGRVEKACGAIAEHVPSEGFGLHFAPMGEVMGRIMESPEPRLRCVLCKRSMYRIASAFAMGNDARGIVTGESLGQVASQTLDNLYVLDGATDIPVLRPNIGLDKVEIEDIARRIGTYEVTARKVEGCTVVPDKPTTKARMEQVLQLEEELGLVDLCSEATDRITFKEFGSD